MASDRHGSLKTAEKLFKQGKVQEALAQLQKLAQARDLDPLTLNRMGDMLSRQGLNEEATGYYIRIADQFTRQGFFPKAIAIHKKILRLDPSGTSSLIQLGDLYANLKLPGEARGYYLRAADELLRASDFAAAREVYERLVAAEPENPRHRARLAETLAAEGNPAGAADELISLADTLFQAGNPEDAEKTYRRADELAPGKATTLVGIANCLAEQGQEEEAQSMLEEAAGKSDADPRILGQVWLRHELGGREAQALELLRERGHAGVSPELFRKAAAFHAGNGSVESFWTRYDPVLDGCANDGQADLAIDWLTAAVDAEEAGHLEALERLELHLEVAEDTERRIPALERLAAAYLARSRDADADAVKSKLAAVAGSSSVTVEVAEPAAVEAPVDASSIPLAVEEAPPMPAQVAAPPADAAPPTGAVADAVPLPKEIEAPAVPLSRPDEEFVAGRLTQSEILEKYGLADQALEQVVEITTKFPGHEAGQERRVQLLRTVERPKALCAALVALAVARRASGNVEGATQAAEEAGLLSGFSPEDRALMERLELFQPAPAPTPVASAPLAPAPPAATSSSDGDVILIDFDAADDDDGEVAAEAPEPAKTAAPPVVPTTPVDVVESPAEPDVHSGERVPAVELLDDIHACLEADQIEPAAEKAAALRVLGYGGDRLAELEARIVQATPVGAGIGSGLDDDLETITAALESELFDDGGVTHVPAAESEESLEEVFAKFKEHVQAEVEPEDYRTHYDLGIAYKEMGLVGEAIGEFGIAAQSPDFTRDASTMLALCHREREETGEAVRYYRQALDVGGDDAMIIAGLRYDLADTLLQDGDREAALDLFRNVHEATPGFRDVGDRLAELEAGG